MSALHGPARVRKPRTGGSVLNIVPKPSPGTPRAPFVTLVALTIAAGLVGLLVLNTAMQKNAFELANLQEKAKTLSTQEASLRADVERLSSPGHVAQQAGDLGMVPNSNPVFLRMSDGKVIGKAEPAESGTNLPGIEPPGPTPEEVAAKKAAAKKAAEKKAAEKKVAEKKAAEKKAERERAERSSR